MKKIISILYLLISCSMPCAYAEKIVIFSPINYKEVTNDYDRNLPVLDRAENYRNRSFFTSTGIEAYKYGSLFYKKLNITAGYKAKIHNSINYYLGYNTDAIIINSYKVSKIIKENGTLYNTIEINNISISYLLKNSISKTIIVQGNKKNILLLEYKKQFSDDFCISPYASISLINSYMKYTGYLADPLEKHNNTSEETKYQLGIYSKYQLNKNFGLSINAGMERTNRKDNTLSTETSYYAHTKLSIGKEDSIFKILLSLDKSYSAPIDFLGTGIKLQFNIV